jgi:hypothetical protein
MKAISIRQPWAYLIVSGVKDIENRSWKTKHRGHILIHAALKIEWDAVKSLNIPESEWHLFKENRGGIVGETEIVDCVTQSKSVWFEGPFGFVLTNSKKLPFIQTKGKLGIFTI